MTGVTVDGVGMTEFVGSTDRSVVELAETAAREAIADADLSPSAVSSVHVGNALTEAVGAQSGLANALVGALGIEGARADRIENTSASGASAVHRGIEAVMSGTTDVAVVVGVERMSGGETQAITDAISRLVHDREYRQGLTLPSFAGLAASAYLDRYDAPREALAAIAAKNHANAANNPYAHFQSAVTVAEALDSPIVADPIRLYDCCPVTDGAAAIVLSRDTASVHIAAIDSATGSHAVAEREDVLSIESVRLAGERVFGATDWSPADVDVACIHDAFSILELLELEELGFYARGTAWSETMDGDTAIDGSVAVNPGGGLKARGHPLGATGVAQLVELVWQLRGEATPGRQVTDPAVGLAVNVAGFGNNSVCTIVESTSNT